MTEQAVDIKTPDGVADSHVFYPDGPGSWPAVIFFMDGLGIRPEMHAMARRLASAGYYVVQPNLYYRAGRRAAFRRLEGVRGRCGKGEVVRFH